MANKRIDRYFGFKAAFKTLTVSSLMLGCATLSAYSAEWLLSALASPISNIASKAATIMAETAKSYVEVEKNPDDMFNEGIANSDRSLAEKGFLKAIDEIKLGLEKYGVTSNKQLEEQIKLNENVVRLNATFLEWYMRYRFGFLILDFTDAFHELCRESSSKIDKLIPQPLRITGNDQKKVEAETGFLKSFQDEINSKKLKIGAKLYYAFPYTRGGGPADRFTKHRQTVHDRTNRWGSDYFPKESDIKYNEEASETSPDSSQALRTIILRVREAYRTTLEVLNAGSSIYTMEHPSKLGKHREISAIFQGLYPDRDFSACNIKDCLFSEEAESKQSARSLSSSPTSPSPLGQLVLNRSQSIPVPKRSSTSSQVSTHASHSPSVRSPSNSLSQTGSLKKLLEAQRLEEGEGGAQSDEEDEQRLEKGYDYDDQDSGDGEKKGLKLPVHSSLSVDRVDDEEKDEEEESDIVPVASSSAKDRDVSVREKGQTNDDGDDIH